MFGNKAKLCYLILILCNLVIAEDVYQYQNASGNMVIGNQKPAGYIIRQNASASQIDNYISPRENSRNKILQEELNHEKLALLQSQKLLTQAIGQKNRLDILDKDIALHHKNIEILTKQLNQ